MPLQINSSQAKAGAKGLLYQSAFLAGLGVTDDSSKRLGELIDEKYSLVEDEKQPEAVASLLKVISEAITYAKENGLTEMTGTSIVKGRKKACPVYPFD